MTTSCEIRKYDDSIDRASLIDLWKTVFNYDSKRNDPRLSIEKKIANDDLLFVAVQNGELIGSIMVGYDGHRGWLYSLAVTPDSRENGIGSALLEHAESCLSQLGCLKINLQILEGNREVEAFYKSRGYQTEPRISMGKELSENLSKGKE